jgi:hypothetical protein
VAGPQLEPIARLVRRTEERKAVDVVDVGVGKEEMSLELVPAVEVGAQDPQPGAGVEDQALLAAHDLDACRVAAIP